MAIPRRALCERVAVPCGRSSQGSENACWTWRKSKGLPLPPSYHRLFWTRFAFGFPASAAVRSILGLMITGPAFCLRKDQSNGPCQLRETQKPNHCPNHCSASSQPPNVDLFILLPHETKGRHRPRSNRLSRAYAESIGPERLNELAARSTQERGHTYP